MGAIFPTDAPGWSDALLVLEIVLAALLVVGLLLVRRGHVRAHRALQSTVILVNLPLVLYAMVPVYLSSVQPYLGTQWMHPDVWVPTAMLVAGGIAEALGVYIILVAGTNWVPARYRFRSYKLWMRTELALWWAVVLTGLTTYWLFYVPGATL